MFKIAGKQITAQVLKFQMDQKECNDVPEVGTPIGRLVRIHVLFHCPRIFEFLQDFKKASAVPDSITINNGKDGPDFKQVVIELYPIRWVTNPETGYVEPYDRVQAVCTAVSLYVKNFNSKGYLARFELDDGQKRPLI